MAEKSGNALSWWRRGLVGAGSVALGGGLRLLGAVEEWWAARDFAPDRAACLAELRRLTAMSPPAAGS